MKTINRIIEGIRDAIREYRQSRMRKAIEAKYKSIFMMCDMDFNGYMALQRAKNEEMWEHGL